ncbi:MAG TPA: dihydroorotate dehydrogenase electron transfer subunit [Anaerolineae bacterium]|nr:dihydroorotate dehydrogenase electron transfer subunit [Anaerolineae bacterium]
MTLPTVVHIRHIQDENRRVRTLTLDMELPEAEPGQFVMLWLPGVDEKPISIAFPAPLTLTVARVGPFSTALHQVREGHQVGVRGPFGHGFLLREDRPALLVGGGYGAAPLYFLATRAVERSIPTTVALGARRATDLIYTDRFRALTVQLLLATDDGSLGHRGYVTDLVSQFTIRNQQFAIYACGPEQMLVTLLHLCLERHLPGQFSVERYMKCGFGLCGQCALNGLLVCQDGPVLTVEQLEGLQDFGRFRRSATGRRLPIQ